jgi:iron complex outermembrane receptor protein
MTIRNITIFAGMVSVLSAPLNAEVESAGGKSPSSSSNFIEEVLVTARRKEENAQTVPVSVNAFSGEAIKDSGIEDTTQLQFFVPGVVFSGAGSNSNTTFSIRGQGKDVIGPGLPSVVNYINEVPMPSWGSVLPTYDIQSIQVLKGPQGTLFGRNTTGGAVLVYSAPATYEREGHISSTLGEDNWHAVQGAVNIPLLDNKLALRLAANFQRRDGYTEVVGQNNDTDEIHSNAYRATLLWESSEALSNVTVADFYESKTSYGGVQIIALGNFRPWTGSPLEPAFDCGVSVECDVDLQFERQKQAGVRKTYSSLNGSYNNSRYWGVANTTVWQLDNVDIKNIFGYRRTDVSQSGEVDGTSLVIADQYFGYRNDEQFSNELQFSGLAFNDRLNWIAGGFLLYDRPTGATSLGLDILRPSSVPVEAYTQSPDTASKASNTLYVDKSKALFANASYDIDSDSAILSRMTLNAGYRYTWDSEGVCAARPQPLTAQPVTSLSDCEAMPDSFSGTEDFSAGTYTIGLDYQISDAAFVYITNRRGYRAGGINTPELSPQLSAYQSYDPQKVTDIELGAKLDWALSNWFGRFNISVFNGEFTDLQRQIRGITPGFADVSAENTPSNTALTVNGGEAEVRGVEIDGIIAADFGLSISYSAAYLDPKYTSQDVPEIFSSISGDLNQFSNSPEFSYSVGVSYDLPYRGELGKFALDLHYAYVDTYYVGSAEVQNHEVVDAGLHWREIAGHPFSASLFVNNVLDEEYVQNISSSSDGLGVLSGTYAPPRLIGVRLSYDF